MVVKNNVPLKIFIFLYLVSCIWKEREVQSASSQSITCLLFADVASQPHSELFNYLNKTHFID